ncbi:EamA family transporter [Streptomyces smaragdinus]|uniref:EamA family transporter n=1 Tax=Streptomyces smaragdinus TaxID=2585196 RepID=UPI0018865C20|nr:DMT family transporter [Streptomyces smaragdinus]
MTLVSLSAAGFGLLPLLAIWGADSGLGVLTLLTLRFILTALVLPLLTQGDPLPRPTGRQFAALALLGFLFAVQSVLYLLALEHISPGLAVLIHYLYPVFVLVLSATLRHDRTATRIIPSLAVALIGLGLTVGPPGSFAGPGVLYALACSVVYAVYVVVGTRISPAVPPRQLTQWVVVFAAVSLALVAVPTGRFAMDFEPAGWAVIAAIAILSTAMPIALFFAGSATLGATRASIISMAEPVVGVLTAWVALGVGLSTLQLFGGTILLVGAAMSVRVPASPLRSE